MSEIIQNKVAKSSLITIDLAKYIPSKIEVIEIEDFLFQKLILKEKEFRTTLKATNFSVYEQQYICIQNKTNAIVPAWSYMLLCTYLSPYTPHQYIGSKEDAKEYFTLENIKKIDVAQYQDKRVIIKGCGDEHISNRCYCDITKTLLPSALSIMYGEACSTVPIYKKKKVS